jgi:hypothetical protein
VNIVHVPPLNITVCTGLSLNQDREYSAKVLKSLAEISTHRAYT